jgi:hypothetical protein
MEMGGSIMATDLMTVDDVDFDFENTTFGLRKRTRNFEGR